MVNNLDIWDVGSSNKSFLWWPWVHFGQLVCRSKPIVVGAYRSSISRFGMRVATKPSGCDLTMQVHNRFCLLGNRGLICLRFRCIHRMRVVLMYEMFCDGNDDGRRGKGSYKGDFHLYYILHDKYDLISWMYNVSKAWNGRRIESWNHKSKQW